MSLRQPVTTHCTLLNSPRLLLTACCLAKAKFEKSAISIGLNQIHLSDTTVVSTLVKGYNLPGGSYLKY